MWRRLGTLLASLLLLPLLLLLTGAPVHAASGPEGEPGGLELSVDGETWGDELPGELFPSSVLIVPGGTVTTGLWVRNASRERARLEVVVSTAVGAGSGLGSWVQVELEGEPTTGGSTWRGPVLGPGQSHRIGIQVHLPVEAPNETRADSTPVLDTVRLVGPDALAPPVPVPPDAHPDDRAGADPGRGVPSERLAVTGTGLALLGLVALLLALAGAWVLRARHRAGAARRPPTGLSGPA